MTLSRNISRNSCTVTQLHTTTCLAQGVCKAPPRSVQPVGSAFCSGSSTARAGYPTDFKRTEIKSTLCVTRDAPGCEIILPTTFSNFFHKHTGTKEFSSSLETIKSSITMKNVSTTGQINPSKQNYDRNGKKKVSLQTKIFLNTDILRVYFSHRYRKMKYGGDKRQKVDSCSQKKRVKSSNFCLALAAF